MIKNIKRAIVLGAALWAIIFAVISIVIFVPGLKDITWLRWLIDWMVVGAASFFLAKLYFKKTSGNVLDGLVLGIFWLAAGVVLDLFITVPLFITRQVQQEFGPSAGYAEAAGYFFYQWQLWVGFVVLVVVTAFAAKMMRGKDKEIPSSFNYS